MTYSLEEIPWVAQKLLSTAPSKTLGFYGAMGSGKTTLIKALVAELGGDGTVQSPTFGIVNEYHHKDGRLLGYHFDFYRLQDESEALDLGLEDYLNQNVWIFMEWPEKIPSLLPDDTTPITLQIVDDHRRRILFGRQQG